LKQKAVEFSSKITEAQSNMEYLNKSHQRLYVVFVDVQTTKAKQKSFVPQNYHNLVGNNNDYIK
jgi:hypothetical protein